MKRIHIIIGFLIFFSIIAFSQQLLGQFTQAVVSISGTVKNAVTKEPMTVYVTAYDDEGKKVNVARSNASDNGYYFLTGLKPGRTYTIVAEQPRFIREEYKLFVPKASQYTEYSKDFSLIPIVEGTSIPIEVPPFELNKSKIRFGAEIYLEPFAREFALNKNIVFEIICYPDNAKDANENLKLTEERAKSLMAYFIGKGIEPERIRIKGNSSTDPKNPPPLEKRAKGKRYIGTTYIKLLSLK
ncbi:MAG: OmpA family protein [Ignavibacteria bacterium]|nr:OmpA family protein [Ignavibacteria bacterium]